MSEPCKFIYDGRTGPRGKVCGRPESEHCQARPGNGDCAHRSGEMVHHTFTRRRRCPTCGCGEVHA